MGIIKGFDYSRYEWKQDHRLKLRYKRQPVGAELLGDYWTFNQHGEQNLYLGVYATLSLPCTNPRDLLQSLRQAWIRLRWDLPTIACQTHHEDSAKHPSGSRTPFLVYDSPCSSFEAASWAEKTVVLHTDFEDLDALRYNVRKNGMSPEDTVPQTYLHLLSFSSTDFGLLLQTSSTQMDGHGALMAMTKLLDILSKYIAHPSDGPEDLQNLDWGTRKETENLLPAAIEILREHQSAHSDDVGNVVKEELPKEEKRGRDFKKTLNECITDAEKHKKLEHPLKSYIQPSYSPSDAEPSSRRMGHTFTMEESKRIVQAGKVDPTDHFTVNELIHGALCTLIVIDNPPSDESNAALWFMGIADLRSRLKEKWRGPFSYPGSVVGASSMAIPVSIATPFRDDPANYGRLVLAFARAVRIEYKKQRECRDLLGVQAEMVDNFVRRGDEMPLPIISPWYAGDGRGSDHLWSTYPIAPIGPPVIEVTDFFTSVDKARPGPMFRATEWKGEIKLSVDFNEKAITPEVVKRMIAKWSELILAASASRNALTPETIQTKDDVKVIM